MINSEKKTEDSIRWGMVGGGRGGNIGFILRSSALRDRTLNLIAGAFDIVPEHDIDHGNALGLDPARCYPDYMTMFAEEAKRPDGVEAVTIVMPNRTQYTIAKAALQAGLHVIIEKPFCVKTEEAIELLNLSIEENRVFGVAYGYSGHQVIEQGRQMVAHGDLGEIKIVEGVRTFSWTF